MRSGTDPPPNTDWVAGLSPWPEDFDIMGVPFARRGKRMDECMEIVRGLTGGGYFEFHGEFYDIPAIKICPTPTEPIPLLVGGHADAALKRAVTLGDGWMHGGGVEDLGGVEAAVLVAVSRAVNDEFRAATRSTGTKRRRVKGTAS